ncbi:MAG TPA: hypothetical protein VFU19_09375 [Iamia sp.]|nr:hypothetical protein [Iamia sp.]
MPHPTRTPRPLPRAALEQLAPQIAEAHAGVGHASLIRVRPRPTSVEIGLCALPEGVHPGDALLGHVVPPSWAASGVVAPAWARPLEQAAAAGTGTRTTVVALVGRDGLVASHAIGVDGVEAGAAPPVGRIPDLLHRTLGLPTPAPEVSAAEWWRACWLDALVAAAAVDPGRTPEVDRPVTSTLPPALVQALVEEPVLCTEAGWPRLRALAAAPTAPDAPGPAAVRAALAPHVSPELAAWFDDGSFARWLLDALPSVDELLELAGALVMPTTHRLLRHVSGREGPDGGRTVVAPTDDDLDIDLDVDLGEVIEHDPGDDDADGEPAPQGARGGADPPR